jgi:hypothetical protein
VYGHTTLNTPDRVWSWKLAWLVLGWEEGGGGEHSTYFATLVHGRLRKIWKINRIFPQKRGEWVLGRFIRESTSLQENLTEAA